MVKRFVMVLASVGLLTIAACNTFEGVGKDVESGGEGISDTARDVKKKI